MAPGQRADRYVVEVPTLADDLGLHLLAAVLRAHPGSVPVEIRFRAEGRGLVVGEALRVDGGPGLARDIAAIPFAPPTPAAS